MPTLFACDTVPSVIFLSWMLVADLCLSLWDVQRNKKAPRCMQGEDLSGPAFVSGAQHVPNQSANEDGLIIRAETRSVPFIVASSFRFSLGCVPNWFVTIGGFARHKETMSTMWTCWEGCNINGLNV